MPLITEPIGVLAILLGVLAVIFWLTEHKTFGRVFKVVPALVFCYFVPTTLTTLGVLPESSPLYSWIKAFVLPASLLLLILALDVPGIIRLGPKAGIMLLAGTVGVVIGGPISLLVCKPWLPDDAWQGMAALAGSWIGGGANFVAMGEMAGASDSMIALMVIPDVFVGSIWMGVLLYLSNFQNAIDRRTGANAKAIRDLEQRLTDFQDRVTRVPKLADLIIIVAFGFLGSWVSHLAGRTIHGSFERALTVDAVRIRADADESSRTFVKLGNEKISETDNEFRLTLAVETSTSGEPAPDQSDRPASHTDQASSRTHKINLESQKLATLNDVVAHINDDVPGWSAELLEPFESNAAAAATRLRAFGRKRLSPDGYIIRLPDPSRTMLWNFHASMAPSTWKYIIITALGVMLSFTRARNLEGAGASKIGSVMIYLLVACIGAGANFRTIFEHPAVLIMGFIWMAVHIVVLLVVAKLIRAPLFFIAVGSQANIGGAASAPVVAAAFHPALAPVGALLAVAGYVLGTYAGWVCMQLLRLAAGA